MRLTSVALTARMERRARRVAFAAAHQSDVERSFGHKFFGSWFCVSLVLLGKCPGDKQVLAVAGQGICRCASGGSNLWLVCQMRLESAGPQAPWGLIRAHEPSTWSCLNLVATTLRQRRTYQIPMGTPLKISASRHPGVFVFMTSAWIWSRFLVLLPICWHFE